MSGWGTSQAKSPGICRDEWEKAARLGHRPYDTDGHPGPVGVRPRVALRACLLRFRIMADGEDKEKEAHPKGGEDGAERPASTLSGREPGDSKASPRVEGGNPPKVALSRFEADLGNSASPTLQTDEDSPKLTRVRVAHGDVERPFMRGILVHSLTEQGVPFEDAYKVAQGVWRRVRNRTVVTHSELSRVV